MLEHTIGYAARNLQTEAELFSERSVEFDLEPRVLPFPSTMLTVK